MLSNMKKATRLDVAKRAGVTPTIVSYVVNDNRYVVQEKRDSVLKAIKELNYQPNPIARSLKGKNSFHILFIADQIDNEHFGKIVREMDGYAYEKGYLISLIANRNDDKFIQHIISRRVDGIIISSISFSEEHIEKILQAGIPVVLLMNRFYKAEFQSACKIYPGLYHGMRNNVRHLYEKGRRNLLYIDRISKRGNYSSFNDLRYKAFFDECNELGINISDNNIVSNCVASSELIDKIADCISKDNRIDAIVCRNDLLALMALNAVMKTNKSVPNDISIIGFDNNSASSLAIPSLTTTEIDRTTIAKVAVNMICDMIEGKAPYTVDVETKFVERKST